MMGSAAPWFSDPSTIPAPGSLALDGPSELDRKTGCSWKRPRISTEVQQWELGRNIACWCGRQIGHRVESAGGAQRWLCLSPCRPSHRVLGSDPLPLNRIAPEIQDHR